jgi:hypothetical protein
MEIAEIMSRYLESGGGGVQLSPKNPHIEIQLPGSPITINTIVRRKAICTEVDRNDVVGHKNQDPKKCEIILFFK